MGGADQHSALCFAGVCLGLGPGQGRANKLCPQMLLGGCVGSCLLSQTHRIVWVGRDLQRSCSPVPPSEVLGTSSTRSGSSKPYPVALNTSSDDASTILGNLSQCLTTLIIKHFFLMSSLTLSSFSLKLLPLVLSLQGLVEGLFLSCL